MRPQQRQVPADSRSVTPPSKPSDSSRSLGSSLLPRHSTSTASKSPVPCRYRSAPGPGGLPASQLPLPSLPFHSLSAGSSGMAPACMAPACMARAATEMPGVSLQGLHHSIGATRPSAAPHSLSHIITHRHTSSHSHFTCTHVTLLGYPGCSCCNCS